MSNYQPAQSESPVLSVIIPVYNDPEGIKTTLDSLVQQGAVDINYEILVIDNNSTDETPAVIETYASDYPEISRYEETDIQSSYAARNTGIENASGDILVFIDADMWVEEGFINEVYEYMEQVDAPYVGLNVSMAKGDGLETIAGKYNYLTGFPIERYITESNYAGAGNLVVEKTLFDDVGWFDENMISNGDTEFGKRVANAGYEQIFCDEIIVYHPVRDSTVEMLQKAIRIGRGKVQFSQLHPEVAGGRDLTDPRVYLPPHPLRMKNLVDGRSEVTWLEFIPLYFFGIIYKYVRLYGMLLETLKIKYG